MTGLKTNYIYHVKLQEKYPAKRTNLYLTFMDLEKPFDHVPRQVPAPLLPKIRHTYSTMMKVGSYTLPKEGRKNV